MATDYIGEAEKVIEKARHQERAFLTRAEASRHPFISRAAHPTAMNCGCSQCRS
jgi:hypothetical protein